MQTLNYNCYFTGKYWVVINLLVFLFPNLIWIDKRQNIFTSVSWFFILVRKLMKYRRSNIKKYLNTRKRLEIHHIVQHTKKQDGHEHDAHHFQNANCFYRQNNFFSLVDGWIGQSISEMYLKQQLPLIYYLFWLFCFQHIVQNTRVPFYAIKDFHHNSSSTTFVYRYF